jgi:hypothetical protein
MNRQSLTVYTVQEDVAFCSINLARPGNQANAGSITLEPLSLAPRSLSSAKVTYIRKLLKYVPTTHHSFYETVLSDCTSCDDAIHYYEDELLEESEDELLDDNGEDDSEHGEQKTVKKRTKSRNQPKRSVSGVRVKQAVKTTKAASEIKVKQALKKTKEVRTPNESTSKRQSRKSIPVKQPNEGYVSGLASRNKRDKKH